MNENLTWDWIGGVAGVLIGFIGAAFGIYAALKNTENAQERTFVIKASFITATLVLMMLTGLFLLPKPYNQAMWLMLLPLLGSIPIWNKKQAEIRNKTTGQNKP